MLVIKPSGPFQYLTIPIEPLILLRRKERAMVDEGIVQDFKKRLRGELIRVGDDSYDSARKIFNAMIDRRPDVIVRCAGAGDVTRCVEFAREHHLQVSVRGGGHSIAGKAVADGGLLIDLSRMK